MNPIFDSVPPQDALELEQVARLIYESRENRRKVLSAVGASDEAELLARITNGAIDEHPAADRLATRAVFRDGERGGLERRLDAVARARREARVGQVDASRARIDLHGST